jgi:hypothetical protein
MKGDDRTYEGEKQTDVAVQTSNWWAVSGHAVLRELGGTKPVARHKVYAEVDESFETARISDHKKQDDLGLSHHVLAHPLFYLTAPWVIPLIKYSCAIRNTTKIGAMPITTPAAMRVGSAPYCPRRSPSETVSV